MASSLYERRENTFVQKTAKCAETSRIFHSDGIVSDEFANVTFTGGDPFFRPLGFAKLAEKLKAETNKNIWCYTGYLFENLVKNENAMKLLKHLDVLVDGPFRQELRDEDLLYRGSSNQRLVDVQKSLAAGKFVEFDYNPYKLK
ncbi:MAG: radical SAM protein [Paludibacteraceae bacterium]|nr:radical SAM protein [Paludibacteraceae bacterium]